MRPVVFLMFLQFLKKLNRQERVVEEVKLVLKPHYTKKHVTKEEYKDIMRKAVPKVNIKFNCNPLILRIYRTYQVYLS